MAHWHTDSSSGFIVNGNVVTHTDESGGGNVFNCMWVEDDGVSSGCHYWKIHLDALQDGGGIGLTSKDYFKDGYACRSIAYSGNLSNGIGLLVANFGVAPCAGDTVGLLASFVDDRLKVYYDINGKNLGLAFDIPSSTFKSVFPFVFFNTSGSASINKETEPPTNTERISTIFTGIEGDWKLKSLIEADEKSAEICPEIEQTLTTKLRKDGDNEYVWVTNVVNTVISRLWMEAGKWKTSHTLSTMMQGSPEAMDVEKKIVDLIEGLTTINVENGELVSKSEELSSYWTRFDATPAPFIGEPFN